MPIGAATLAKWGIPIALDIGHSWLQGRDIKKAQKKAEKENRRAQAMSNLINALSPSVRHQPYLQEAEYRPSGLTRALGAAKLGYGAYTGLKGAIAKEAAQKGAQELQDLAIGEAKRKKELQEGFDFATGSKAGKGVAGVPQNTGGMFGSRAVHALPQQVPEGATDAFRSGAQSVFDANLAATQQARQERADVLYERNVEQRKLAEMERSNRARERTAAIAQAALEETRLYERNRKERLEQLAREKRELDEIQESKNRELFNSMVDRAVKSPSYFHTLTDAEKKAVRPLVEQIKSSEAIASGDPEKGFIANDYGILLSEKTREELANNKAAVESIRGLIDDMEKNAGVLGGFANVSMENIYSAFPGTEAYRIEERLSKRIETMTRALAKAKETGVLTDVDWDFWLSQVPDVHDNWSEVAKPLLDQMLNELSEQGSTTLEAFRQDGYRIADELEIFSDAERIERELNRRGGNG